jgi:hypothetical protein
MFVFLHGFCNRDADEMRKLQFEMADVLSQLSASKQEVKVCSWNFK